MRFEAPWMLFGMAAMAVPVIIHLINRRRARIIDFPAIDFLLMSDKRVARRMRIRQWLVLAVRTALMGALPFALARPYCSTQAHRIAASGRPEAIVFVVDNSASMSLEVDETSLLERARRTASDWVREAAAGSSFGVVSVAPPRALTRKLTAERTAALDAIASVEESARRGDTVEALRLAAALLGGPGAVPHRIVVLTDAQRSAWCAPDEANGGECKGFESPWKVAPAAVDVVDVTPRGAKPANRAVCGAQSHPSADDGGAVEVEVRVCAWGAPWQGPVTVESAGRTVESTVEVAADADATARAVVPPPPEGEAIRVRLPADTLTVDDERSVVPGGAREVNVLVVDGAPRTVSYRDEVFFLERALQPLGPSDPAPVHERVVTSEAVVPAHVQAADVVVLANVLRLPAAVVDALRAHLARGGGILWTAGDNVTPAYNRDFAGLLPMPVRSVVEPPAHRGNARRRAVEALYVDEVDGTHPVMASFARSPDASLFHARAWSYVLLDASGAKPGTKVLARWSNGAPFLVERRISGGRVVFWTTSADRDWSDLPIRTSYLPLVRQLVRYLAGRLDAERSGPAKPGDPLSVDLLPETRRAVVVLPDGTTARPPVDRDKHTLVFEETDLPGAYRIEQRDAEGNLLRSDVFEVVLDPRESDVRRLPPARIEALLVGGDQSDALAQGSGDAPPPGGRQSVWPFVLAGLFGLLLAEAIIVVRS